MQSFSYSANGQVSLRTGLFFTAAVKQNKSIQEDFLRMDLFVISSFTLTLCGR